MHKLPRKPYCIRIPQELLDAIRALAAARGCTVSRLVCHVMQQVVDRAAAKGEKQP